MARVTRVAEHWCYVSLLQFDINQFPRYPLCIYNYGTVYGMSKLQYAVELNIA